MLRVRSCLLIVRTAETTKYNKYVHVEKYVPGTILRSTMYTVPVYEVCQYQVQYLVYNNMYYDIQNMFNVGIGRETKQKQKQVIL